MQRGQDPRKDGMNKRTLLAAASALSLLILPVLILVRVVSSLPDIRALEQVAAGDSDIPVKSMGGELLYEYHSPAYGEKKAVQLSEISDELIALTITTEDSRFFVNPGFSPAAILRAIFQNLIMRRTFSGASTITQQVVKNILLPPDERYDRSLSRKAKEILLAAVITARYDKEMILSVYLNEIYYGRNATGVEKAAELYFGKRADELSLSEAAFIAGLPQAPNYYGYDLSAGRSRQKEVLRIFERIVEEEHCIALGSGIPSRVYCPDIEEIRNARRQELQFSMPYQ